MSFAWEKNMWEGVSVEGKRALSIKRVYEGRVVLSLKPTGRSVWRRPGQIMGNLLSLSSSVCQGAKALSVKRCGKSAVGQGVKVLVKG